MLVNESVLVGRYLFSALENSQTRRVLNIGSSSLEYRSQIQPYIEREVFYPVTEKLGATIVHCDAKEESGADLIVDLLAPEAVALLRALSADAFVVANLLEHVEVVDDAVLQLDRIITSGSYLVASGPKSFPYHPDPIDNMFRPERWQVQSLFRNFDLIEWGEVNHRTLARSVSGSRKQAARFLFREFASAPPGERIAAGRRSLTPVSAWCALMRKK